MRSRFVSCMSAGSLMGLAVGLAAGAAAGLLAAPMAGREMRASLRSRADSALAFSTGRSVAPETPSGPLTAPLGEIAGLHSSAELASPEVRS